MSRQWNYWYFLAALNGRAHCGFHYYMGKKRIKAKLISYNMHKKMKTFLYLSAKNWQNEREKHKRNACFQNMAHDFLVWVMMVFPELFSLKVVKSIVSCYSNSNQHWLLRCYYNRKELDHVFGSVVLLPLQWVLIENIQRHFLHSSDKSDRWIMRLEQFC